MEGFPVALTRQEGVGSPVWRAKVADGDELVAVAVTARQAGGRLAALWGSDNRPEGEGFRLDVVFAVHQGHLWCTLPLSSDAPLYPDLSGIFPAASRMERATRDLVGIVAEGCDPRPWLRHGGWPADWYPLQSGATEPVGYPNQASDYPFVVVRGEGVHEIPVGPIHAGIIEPGHFRFSVVGERILRMEERLGYQHRGIEQRARGAPIATGAKLAGRVSGDSTCAFAWAYAAAIEAACGAVPSARALTLRAILLERERVANHLGDLGALGNDAALAFGLSQFLRLKEEWVRSNAALFGHRYLMDRIVPGGVAVDLDSAAADALVAQCNQLEAQVQSLCAIYDEHGGLQDRFMTTGAIDADLAREWSLTGVAARATGLLLDGRVHRLGYTTPPPYDRLGVRPATAESGDVAARVSVRFDELFESLRLLRLLARALPEGELLLPVTPRPLGEGLGVVEGWRGEVVVGVVLDSAGNLARFHPHDPSWQAWPVLEHAVMRDIVPDFPLINKSFNLSYAGHDL